MSTALAFGQARHVVAGIAASKAPRMVLLGTGTVGRALVARYRRLRLGGMPLPELALIANSRDVLASGDDV
ncbi:MAG: hypothetical protein ABIO38_06930, partial [Luteimonas sp.]